MSDTHSLLVTRGARPAHGEQDVPALDCRIEGGEMVFLSAADEGLLTASLKMLAGVEMPRAGEVEILQRNTCDLDQLARQDLRREAGYVLRGAPLLSNLDGDSNLRFAANYHAIGTADEQRQRIEDLLGGLIEAQEYRCLPAYMTELQRRLIAITRPLMLYPKILFLEFPFNGLGFADRVTLAGYLEKIAQLDHIAIVICSDDMYCMQRLAQRIVRYEDDAVTIYPAWADFYRAGHDSIEQLSWAGQGPGDG